MIKSILFFGFIIRTLNAFWNSFYGPSFSAGIDDISFHLDAVDVSNNLIFDNLRIGWIYSDFLGLIYYFFTDSLFLGCLLSTVAWLISSVFLLKIFKILSIRRRTSTLLILFYTLLPSSIMFTSITLRESYQLLFLNLLIYSYIQIYLLKNNNYWLIILLSIFGAGILHGGIIIFCIIFFIIFITDLFFFNPVKITLNRLMLFIIIILALFYFLILFIDKDQFVFLLNLGEEVEIRQLNLISMDARSQYIDNISIGGFGDLILFIPKSFLLYFLEPFPWHITNLADLIVFIENTATLFLLYYSFKNLKYNNKYFKVSFSCLIFYLVLSFIFSMGTNNWGTSVRHHLPALGFLLVAVSVALNRKNYNF